MHFGFDELNQNCAVVGTEWVNGTAEEKEAYVTGVFKQFAEDIIGAVTEATGKKVVVWQDSIFKYDIQLSNPDNVIVQLWDYDPTNEDEV